MATTSPVQPAAEPRWIVVRNTGPSFRTDIDAGSHALVADEPESFGGTDAGPTPYDLLLSAVASCTAMTMRMYASRKAWPLRSVEVGVRAGRTHAADCDDCVDRSPLAPMLLERRIEIIGDLSDEQRERLLAIAERCPVKQILQRGVEIVPA